MFDPIATAPGSDTTTRYATPYSQKTSSALQSGALEQIVGRERNQRACYRQLVRNTVVSRRVNSTVRRLFAMDASELNSLRDDILKLTGVAVVQFQFLEQTLTACMAFVWPEKSEQMMAELESSDSIRRGETIGRMLSVLRKTINVQPNLDKRLSDFLENRNALIHRRFREIARFGAQPPNDQLENTKQFILDLIREAAQLQRIFLGFYSVIGKHLASREGLPLESDLFTYLAPYEDDFNSTFGSGS